MALRSNLIHLASTLPKGSVERRNLLAVLTISEDAEDMTVNTDVLLGMVVVSGPKGTIAGLAREINKKFLPRWRYSGRDIPKVRGALKAFSFHWSNAQAAWDVIPVRSFPWSNDGAEFLVFTMPDARSDIGKPWVIREMQMVAARLRPHPGYADSMEGGQD